jgi:hypothetical protein
MAYLARLLEMTPQQCLAVNHVPGGAFVEGRIEDRCLVSRYLCNFSATSGDYVTRVDTIGVWLLLRERIGA